MIVTEAHRLIDLLKDWIEVYKLTGAGTEEIKKISRLLGLL